MRNKSMTMEWRFRLAAALGAASSGLRRIVAMLGLLAFAVSAGAVELVVAQVSPQQGYLGFYSKLIATGARSAFAAHNARVAQTGEPSIRFEVIDAPGDANATVKLYEQVVQRDAPVAFLYHVGPEQIVGLLGAETFDRLKVPLLGTIPAVDPFRTPLRPYVFHLRRGDEPELASIAAHLVTIGIGSVAVMYLDDPAGRGALPMVRREVAAAGGKVVRELPVAPGKSLSVDDVAALRKSGAQAALLFMPAATAGSVVGKLRSTGVGLPVYSMSYLDATSLVQAAGIESARGVAIAQAFPNPYGSTLPLVREYRRDMELLPKRDRALSPFTLEGYVAARVLIEAIVATKKQQPNGKDVRAALARMNLDLGGLPVRFSSDSHTGLSFRDIGVVDDGGRLRY